MQNSIDKKGSLEFNLDRDNTISRIKTEDDQNNTKEIIKEEEINPFENYKNEIHVHPKGEYKTIQSAINASKPLTKIKIHPGIYKEHITISKTRDIELCSANAQQPAIVLSVNTPCLTIANLSANSSVKITNIRFLHRGMRDEGGNINNTTLDDVNDTTEQIERSALTTSYGHLRSGNSIYGNVNQLDQFETNYNIDMNVIDGIMSDNRGYTCAICIINSTVMISNVQITLGFLTAETTKTIPGIFAERSILFLESVLIKGNSEFLTCGLFSYDSNIKIINSRFIKHISGGILCSVNPKNQVIITKTQMLENTGCGALIYCKDFTKNSLHHMSSSTTKSKVEVSLELNLMDGNKGTGIKIVKCPNLSLIRNKFYDNTHNGAEIIDSDGLCLLNEFVKNGENGLFTQANERTTDLKLNKNVFCENGHNGLSVIGKGNSTQIINNKKITNNMKSGIYVSNESFPIIKENSISTNFFQGILVTSDSNAMIDNNSIFGNIKANIAFGGAGAEKTEIVNNEIFKGRCEGVFCIDGKGGIIARNKIFDNNDGIVLLRTNGIEISENDIFKNVRSGVYVASKTVLSMFRNQIIDNKFIGMYLRDGSKGTFDKNIIRGNPTQIYFTNSCKDLIDPIKKHNKIEGRIDMETMCNIF